MLGGFPINVRDLVTLGPSGTDSENAAKQIMQMQNIPGEIVLCNSFYNAIEHAVGNNSYCLIPAAFQRQENGVIVDTWGNLNFREGSRLELLNATVLPLKEMCFARNLQIAVPETIALHPSTGVFADIYAPNLKRVIIDSKPLAVRACSEGRADACIGSVDVVNSFGNLEIEQRFQPNMIWALYRPRGCE